MAMSIVREKAVVHKIFEEAPERFGSINGGYTRIVKIGRRPGDAAAMTLVELVRADGSKPTQSKKKKTKTPSEDKPAVTKAEVKGTEAVAAKSAAAADGEKSGKVADADAISQAAAEDEPEKAESKTTTDPVEDDK
jgi:large subunit ribosomal protein L17